MRAPAAALGENTEVRLVSLDDARERARVMCVAMKQNLANTPVLLLSEIVDEWFVLNAPPLDVSGYTFFFIFLLDAANRDSSHSVRVSIFFT